MTELVRSQAGDSEPRTPDTMGISESKRRAGSWPGGRVFCPWGPGATHVAESTMDPSAQAAAAVRKTTHTWSLLTSYFPVSRQHLPLVESGWHPAAREASREEHLLSAEQGPGRLVLAANSAEAGTCKNSQYDTGRNSSLTEHMQFHGLLS